MEMYRILAYPMRYALIVVLLTISNYSMMSQGVDLSLNTSYTSLPAIDASKVRMDNKMFVTLVLNDFSRDNYNVRLRLSIEGNGVSLMSSNLSNYKSFALIPGIPKVISSLELADYFDPASLDFFGIDKNAFLENGVLPEGMYKLCFVVVDGETDGANTLSNKECDFLNVQYQEPPEITSDLNFVLDTKTVEWSHKNIFANIINYEFEIYEFSGGKDFEIYTYQKPIKTIKVGSKYSVDISEQISELPKEKIYAFFVKSINGPGFNYLFRNKGYSKPLYFENITRSVNCDGEIEFDIITLPNGTELLYAFVDGCDQLYGAFHYDGIYTNTVPYHENTGYSANIICENEGSTPCFYSATYGNESCFYGADCVSPNGCPGTYGYDCECFEKCISVPIRESYDANGQLVLTPMVEQPGGTSGLPAGCLESGSFMWTNGENTASISPENPNAAYGFKVVCEDGCTYCGSYNNRAGCWPGRSCSDGNPCTINDTYDAYCNCVGEHIENCDPDDPSTGCGGTLGIDIFVDPSGGSFLTANISGISASICPSGSIQYVWNGDYDNNQEYYSTSSGGTVTLMIICDQGCSYSAEVDLNNCTPGTPCEDDNDASTIEYYNENCECVSYDCPDTDGDGLADDCDEDQPCYGEISIVSDLPNQQLYANIENIDCDGGISYLWSSGATTASIPFLNEDATYMLTVTCSSGCQYIATSEGNNEDCIVGAVCENEKSCNGLGTINENCECIPSNPETEFVTDFNINSNQLTLEVELVDGECTTPIYLWSTGESSSSINITDLNATYAVTVSCSENCEFVAFYTFNEGDCIVGAPCNDGVACTYFDTFNEDCECEGVYNGGDDGDITTDDCIEGPCNNYIFCDDGNPCTYFDYIQCNMPKPSGDGEEGNDEDDNVCMGFFLYDADGNQITDCEPDPCIVGFPCNDNDPCTINDMLDENCECTGEQLEDNQGLPLTDCEETNPCDETLEFDVIPTNNYNEILLTANSSCENVDSYLWSNGSSASSIVVATQSGSYTVIITCGECQYAATYDTDGCLIGLPCNDGLDCTENDEVQENCECEGDPIEDVELMFETFEVEEELCDYKICFPDFMSMFFITSIDVTLSNGDPFQINQSLNNQGFDFPYTYSNTDASNYLQLVSDLQNWLPSSASVSFGFDSNSSICAEFITISNSGIEILSLNGYSYLNPNVEINATNEGCNDTENVIGTYLTVVFDCDDVEGVEDHVIWSNGSIGATIFIEDINSFESCLEVKVLCANGCTYYATYNDNCEGCSLGVLGAPCDDNNSCTIGDTVNEDCECIGLPLSDSDEDGICDEQDECPGGDDNIDLNGNGVPDACDDELDCIGLLTGDIEIEVADETCRYCMFINDPIFDDETNDEDIYLESLSVFKNGAPQLLNANTPGFSFPYLIDKESSKLLPQIFITNLNTFLDGDGTMVLLSSVFLGCVQQTETENGTIINSQEGPTLFGNIDLPSILQEMTFVWGENNVIQKSFYNPDPCESQVNPYILTATLAEDCGGEPTYEWNTGSTESTIQVPSLLATYYVTITCGECVTYAQTTPVTGEGCQVGLPCTGNDICNNEYDGFYDTYCNCISETEPDYPDEDQDGIPDCIDDCDSDFEQTVSGEQICCDDPPVLIHDEEPIYKDVINLCMSFKDNEIIKGIRIYNTFLDEGNNYNIGEGYDEGNFFNFPYCIESNCEVYGVDVNIPYNLKPLKKFAYDLQRWAAFMGYSFTTSTVPAEGFCKKCDDGVDQLFINGIEPVVGIAEIFKEEGSEKMDGCDDKVIRGYNVIFEKYEGDCIVTKLTVNTNKVNQPLVIENQNGINLNEFKFGPVPHFGVGFRAIIECADGCVYDITTPDADCIIGDPCDSPDVCATKTYTVHNANDCDCFVLESNDIDEDGVCDDEDICLPDLPYSDGYQEIYDDNLDNDNDGIPNCLDDFCGSEVCTYTLDISSIPCDADDNNGCARIGQITVLLPDGSEIKLGDDPFFDAWYYLGSEPGCTEDQSDELESDIIGWFANHGFVVGSVSVEGYVISITGTNVEFLYALNLCRDKVNFEKSCESQSTLCTVQYLSEGQNNVCEKDVVITSIELTLPNGEYVKLSQDYNGLGFHFPYSTKSPIGSNEPVQLHPNFKNDLMQAYSDIVVEYSEDTNGEFKIRSNVEFRYIRSKCLTWPANLLRIFTCSDAPSSSCDDGWDCTVNDQYDENCNCVGTFLDSDNDMVCDAEDVCEDYPDHIDSDSDGIPDKCDDDFLVVCSKEGEELKEKEYCSYIKDFLSCSEGKVMFNNLKLMNGKLKSLFSNPDMINYMPFPNLMKELIETNEDLDSDGIVDILDPCPCISAGEDGTHPVQCMTNLCGKPECDNSGKFSKKEYSKERYAIMNMFLYSVNPGVLAGTNEDDSNPTYSRCFFELKSEYGLNFGDYNESGYVFSQTTGCYIYFELDCDCNCIVVESQAINYADDCDEPIEIGDECTQDPDLEDEDGYYFVQCPPDGVTDPCLVYAVVPNPDYDPYNPGSDAPCFCQQQMEEDGEPSEMMDSDGDGVCDAFDECPGEVDGDADGDGIPDCLDQCDGIGFVESPGDAVSDPPDGQPILIFATKEGYAAPTGPGDICDDGNPCTYDDVITLDCQCQGVYIDSDDDGVYDCEECEFIYLETIEEIVEVNGEEVVKEKDIYGCVGCNGPVTVDAIGNVTDETDPDANPVANTWIGCDVCPGIPDGDPEDQDDFPMDYDNDGLPDCIDPPFYPIPCPVDYLIIPGVGISLVFDTDNIDVDKLPNPIRLLAKNEYSDQLVDVSYLTVGFVREVPGTEIVDDVVVDITQTEIIFEFDHNYVQGQLVNIQIMFSEHQICTLGGIDDASPVPCPSNIIIYDEAIQIDFDINADDNIDLSEFVGEVTIDPDGSDPAIFEFVVDQSQSSEIVMTMFIYGEIPAGWNTTSAFSGIITLPNGQVCNFTNGQVEDCQATDESGATFPVVPGTACDDGDPCTHHDKYVTQADGSTCLCIGEDKPDTDNDTFCDEIDPCPDFFNELPTEDINGDQVIDHLDINDCYCPELEVDLNFEVNPVLENGNDFVLYLSGDFSEYTSIVYSAENLVDPTISGELSISNPIVISNLVSGYDYTITISAFCGQNEAGSLSYSVNVPFSDNPIICGKDLDKVDVTSLTLLPSLLSGEDFKAADFNINVKEVVGQYGIFSGSGYVSVPYFNQARLNVKFDNVTISADRQLVDGFVYVTGIGLAILGDDLSDAINGELDGIINTLDDASDFLDKIITVLEEIEDYLDSVKDLVTEENLECYLTKKGILEGLIAQYQADNSSVTEEQLKKATADVKDCFNDANEDAIAAVSELMILIEYSFGQFSSTCPSESELINNLSLVGYDIDDSKAIVDNLFDEFGDLTTPNIVPLSSSLISGIEFSKGITSDSDLSNNVLLENPLIASYYESEKELFLCNVSKLIEEEGIFKKDNNNYDQLAAENMLNTIIIAVTNAGANMAKEFAPELLTGIKAEDIFNKDDNAEKIKEMISNALANEVYK